MVLIKDGLVAIKGTDEEVIVETVFHLRTVYRKFVESYGEDEANVILATIGRTAVASDDETGINSLDLM